MTRVLHLTNGDATVPGLLGTGLVDEVLPWRDVLHEGPVPDVPDVELRRLRAAFPAGESAQGATTAGEGFVRAAAKEARPFLGDTWCFDRMRRFVDAPVPLLGAEPDGAQIDRRARLRLTDAGRSVLAGAEDHVTLNGVDRWIGGVHLRGHAVPWRWDEGTESITATAH